MTFKEQWISEGVEQGLEQGLNLKGKEIAEKALAMNLNDQTICQLTGLDLFEIEKIRQTFENKG